MADFSRARRTMETADLIERLKARHDIETHSDRPNETVLVELQEAVLHLGVLSEQLAREEVFFKAALSQAHGYKNLLMEQAGDPDFKRAATQLRLVEMIGDRLRIEVNGFQKAMDEAGHLTGPKGREIHRLIMRYLQHDLAGAFGMQIRYQVRQAVTALRGLPTPTKEDEA